MLIYVAGVLTRLSLAGLRQRHFRVAKHKRGLQAGRHNKFQRHGFPPLDHTFMLRGNNGRVLAADYTHVEQRHELRVGEFRAAVRPNALHNGWDTLDVDVDLKTIESHLDVGLPS